MPVLTSSFIYGLLSLFAIDYLLGNGFADMLQVLFCKVVCVVRKTIRREAKRALLVEPEPPVSLPVMVAEFLVLIFTMVFLNKYTQYKSKDRIDELFQESRDALKQTNEFLEKWRLRRINQQVPTEYSYLDEEPQDVQPLNLEVPLLHMAVIDTLRTTRSQPERGDAGDSYITDSTLLSATSLLDDDLESLNGRENEETNDGRDESSDRNVDFSNRYLWDVMEEDTNTMDED